MQLDDFYYHHITRIGYQQNAIRQLFDIVSNEWNFISFDTLLSYDIV